MKIRTLSLIFSAVVLLSLTASAATSSNCCGDPVCCDSGTCCK